MFGEKQRTYLQLLIDRRHSHCWWWSWTGSIRGWLLWVVDGEKLFANVMALYLWGFVWAFDIIDWPPISRTMPLRWTALAANVHWFTFHLGLWRRATPSLSPVVSRTASLICWRLTSGPLIYISLAVFQMSINILPQSPNLLYQYKSTISTLPADHTLPQLESSDPPIVGHIPRQSFPPYILGMQSVSVYQSQPQIIWYLHRLRLSSEHTRCVYASRPM